MNKSSFIQEEDGYFKKAPTLVRRVSDMFKDGTYSGPPSLFSQKIRHCCQNLNLLPYLLYSFEHSKSHPLAKKVNFCFDLILKTVIERVLFLYTNVRREALNVIQEKSHLSSKKETQKQPPTVKSTTESEFSETKARLQKFQKQKPKENSVLLVIAIYLAPLVLAFQLIGLASLLVFGKYTPGFVFLVTSLMFLGMISMRIMFHDTVGIKKKREERKQKTKQE